MCGRTPQNNQKKFLQKQNKKKQQKTKTKKVMVLLRALRFPSPSPPAKTSHFFHIINIKIK